MFDGSFDCDVDTTADGGWVRTSNDVAKAFFVDRTSQNGRGGGAVTGQVGSLLCDFDDQFGAHVFKTVFQVDFLGDGNTVLGNRWSTVRFIDDHVATGRAHRDGNGISQNVDSAKHACSGVIVKKQLFSH